MPKEEKLAEKPLSPELEQVKGLYDLMLEKGLDALEVKDEDLRVRLTRRSGVPSGMVLTHHLPQARPIESAPAQEAEPLPAAQTIVTPLAGIFYRASSPASAPFLKEGDSMDSGQTLCIVEAMKVMNEIKAESRCRIVKILVENGRPVSANQPLFQIESA